jgi:hypothetical protein
MRGLMLFHTSGERNRWLPRYLASNIRLRHHSALGLSARRGCGGNAEALPPVAPWLVLGSLFPWGISVV